MKTQEIRAIDSKTLWQAINPLSANAPDAAIERVAEQSVEKIDTEKSVTHSTTGEAAPSPKQDPIETVTRLAALSTPDYESIRVEEASQLGWRTSVLDAEVKKAQTVSHEVHQLPFPEVAPCQEPINPSQLLDDIAIRVRKYIVIEPEQADAIALWIAQTWFIPYIDLAALAIINAPEKACGKSQLLSIIGYMSYRPLPAANASASAVFRAVEKWAPTLLVDEADTFFKENTELQGMINAGYLRGGYVLRSEAVGTSFEPRMFSVFSAKAIAGIALEKHLPDATLSRGIVLNLRRKLATESVSRLRHADRNLFGGISSQLARFVEDYAQQVKHARPKLPEALNDRNQDNWEPLLAIAGCAGEAWVKRARDAALMLSNSGEKSISLGNQLLEDIQYVFSEMHDDKISTANLITELSADKENAWATYNYGNPISPRQLAKLLSAYGIHSKTVRCGAYQTPKGFEVSQFTDAFARYLDTPANLTHQGNDATNTINGKADCVADNLQQMIDELLPATFEPSPVSLSANVADDDDLF